MKIVLNGLMMSCASVVLMTLLALGISKAYAAEGQQTEQSNNAQQELVEIFFAAAKTGNNEVISEFLKHGFPVDIQNNRGFTPLMMATYYGHQSVVTTLLNSGANRCIRDQKGHTALMGAIVKAEWSIAKQLKKVDCDVKAKQTGQLTAIEFAKVFGQEQKLRDLVIEK